ncbi:MAG TPA: hypothetical protein VHT24_14605 [Pseudacidobacterium sp.]|jgi:hypothetical protein|nr:hypothetical protein [Pseudacidobacterium sp.]
MSPNFNVYESTQRLRRVAPFEDVDVQRAVENVNDSAKSTLINQGLLPSERDLISAISLAEQKAQSNGVVLARSVPSPSAKFQQVACYAAVIGGVLALGAIFAPEVEIGVIAGVVITSGDLLAAGSAMYGIIGGFTC